MKSRFWSTEVISRNFSKRRNLSNNNFSCNFLWNCMKYPSSQNCFLLKISAKNYFKCLLVFRKSHWISHIFSSQTFLIFYENIFPLFSSLVNDILICYLFFYYCILLNYWQHLLLINQPELEKNILLKLENNVEFQRYSHFFSEF